MHHEIEKESVVESDVVTHSNVITKERSTATSTFNNGALKSISLCKSTTLYSVFAATAILSREYSNFVFSRYQIDYLFTELLICTQWYLYSRAEVFLYIRILVMFQ